MAKSRGWEKSFLKKQGRAFKTKLDECLEQQKRAFNGLAAIERDELKDPIDLASAVLDQESSLDQANDCTKQIFKISRAILAIKDGTYGICDTCNKKITIKRLEAVPWTTKCIDCQQADDELHLF